MIIVDASVAAKWVIDEPGRQSALLVRDLSAKLVAPDLMLAEFANVMRKKYRSGQIDNEQLKAGVSLIKNAIDQFVATTELIEDALILAQELDHSTYDCMYLACALGRGVLLTADETFLSKCQQSTYRRLVFGLEDMISGRLAAALIPLTIGDNTFADIDRLIPLIRKTFDFLEEKSSGDRFGQFVVRSSLVYSPAFSSPAYLRIAQNLENLTSEQVALLLAIGWLGRGYYNGTDWSRLLENARNMMGPDGFIQHKTYIIAQMNSVQAGLAKFRNHFNISE